MQWKVGAEFVGDSKVSNWNLVNKGRVRSGLMKSTDDLGFNGCFELRVTERQVPVKCIASNGMFWQHVSVSQLNSSHPPTWNVMNAVKDLFWEPEDVVMQLHPKKSDYVNIHPGVLHLWRPLKEAIPIPPVEMV